MARIAIVGLLLALGLAGCGKGEKPLPADPVLVTPPPPVDPSVVWGKDQPIQTAYTEFAKLVEKTISRGDPRFMLEHMDYPQMLKLAREKLSIPHSDIVELEKRMKDAGMPAALARELQFGAQFCFVRLRELNGEWRALYRLLGRDGVQYHELILRTNEQREIRIADAYSHHSGARVSEWVYRFMLPLAAQQNKQFAATLSADEQVFAEHINAIAGMQDLMLNARYREALSSYEVMPEGLKRQRDVAVMRIACAKQAGQAEYAEALKDFCKRFEGDPHTDLALLKAYVVLKQDDLAFKAIDRFEKTIGGEAYIDQIRAFMYYRREDYTKARTHARKALEADPRIIRAYYVLFDCALFEKNYAEVSRLLDELNKNLPDNNLNLEQESNFKDFLQSQEYRDWLEKQYKR